MKRNSNILSALMFIINFFSHLLKELKTLKVSEETIFNALKSDDDLIPKMAKKIAEVIAGVPQNILQILANLSLSDRIAKGKYDWVNDDITEKNFPELVPADYTKEFKLFYFDRKMSSEDAIKEMDKDGFRPATINELLAIGEAQPELQKQFPIVALGSLWRRAGGSRSVPVLSQGSSERGLDLRWFERDWDGVFRFAALRK